MPYMHSNATPDVENATPLSSTGSPCSYHFRSVRTGTPLPDPIDAAKSLISTGPISFSPVAINLTTSSPLIQRVRRFRPSTPRPFLINGKTPSRLWRSRTPSPDLPLRGASPSRCPSGLTHLSIDALSVQSGSGPSSPFSVMSASSERSLWSEGSCCRVVSEVGRAQGTHPLVRDTRATRMAEVPSPR